MRPELPTGARDDVLFALSASRPPVDNSVSFSTAQFPLKNRGLLFR